MPETKSDMVTPEMVEALAKQIAATEVGLEISPLEYVLRRGYAAMGLPPALSVEMCRKLASCQIEEAPPAPAGEVERQLAEAKCALDQMTAARSAEREARQKAEQECERLKDGELTRERGRTEDRAHAAEACAAKLAEALRPFADLASVWDGEPVDLSIDLIAYDPPCVSPNLAVGNFRDARSALSDAPEAQGWRPIESAPKDGKPVLLTGMKYGPNLVLGRWGSGRYLGRKRGYNKTWVDQSGEEIDPTHWMPAPPSIAQGEG